MTPIDALMQSMREAAEKATPGEWYAGHFADDSHACNCKHVCGEGYMGAICTIDVANNLPIGEGGNDTPPEAEAKGNLLHIAAASPANILRVLAYVEQMKRALRCIEIACEDNEPPLRSMPADRMRRIASEALTEQP